LRPVLGRLIGPEDDGPNAASVVVLTYRFWSNALGKDPSVIGRTVQLGGVGGDRTGTIIGVLEPCVPYPQETEISENVASSPERPPLCSSVHAPMSRSAAWRVRFGAKANWQSAPHSAQVRARVGGCCWLRGSCFAGAARHWRCGARNRWCNYWLIMHRASPCALSILRSIPVCFGLAWSSLLSPQCF